MGVATGQGMESGYPERTVGKAAVIAVVVSIGPVLFGLRIPFNYLTMGEPW